MSSQKRPRRTHKALHLIGRIFRGVRQHHRDQRLKKKGQTQHTVTPRQTTQPVNHIESEQSKSVVGTGKGVSLYTYICTPGYTVQFSVPGQEEPIINTSQDNFKVKDLEMHICSISPGASAVRLEWRAMKDGVEKASAFNQMSVSSENFEVGTMMSPRDCVPIVTEDAIVNYLFNHAVGDQSDLSHKNQCSVTISPRNYKTWMSDLAPHGSLEAQKPFSRFVLASAHNIGMNSEQSAEVAFQSIQDERLSAVLKDLPDLKKFKDASPAELFGLLVLTQTAPIVTMLSMGVRYFEYRPAKLHPIFQRKASRLRDTFYYTQSFIPGLAFEEFLNDVVSFLDSNQGEIVVVHIRNDGILKECKLPTVEQRTDLLDAACKKSYRPLTWGQEDCLSAPIEALRNANRRLICCTQLQQYSSCDEASPIPRTADLIISKFESMKTTDQHPSDLTLMQCQASNTVFSSKTSSSPSSETKARLNMATLPWLRDNLTERLRAEKTVVIVNDFIDGMTVDTAIQLSRKRLAA